MTITPVTTDVRSLVDHRLPGEVVPLLLPSPVTAGAPGRVGVRLGPGRSGSYSAEVGVFHPLSERIGLGGRMFDERTGNEADFAVVNPEPVTGHVYLAVHGQEQSVSRLLERVGDTWRAFGQAVIQDDTARFLPFAAPHTEGVEPTFWVECKDPRVQAEPQAETQAEPPPLQVHTPPVAEPAHWLRFVRPGEPRAGFTRRPILVLSSPNLPGHDSRPDLVGQLRTTNPFPAVADGRMYDRDSETGALLVGAHANTGHGPGSHHLWWPGRDAMRGGEDPVIVRLADYYAFEVVADSHGNLVTPRPAGGAGFTVPSVWTPPPGVPLNAEALAGLTREFESLWERWAEAMNEAAVDHDWCGDYEKAVTVLGFAGRAEQKGEWLVDISVSATVTISSPSSSVDRALSSEIGYDVVADEVTASVDVSFTASVDGLTRDEVDDYVDSSFVENWLDEHYAGSWDVDNYTVENIEAA